MSRGKLVSPLIFARRLVAGGFTGAVLLGVAAVGCDRLERAKPVAEKPGAAVERAQSDSKSCDDFAARLCSQTANELSTTCIAIRTTVDLLTPEACILALANAEHSLQALSKRDLSCDALQAKLCADTSAMEKSCERVKKFTGKFPPERCKEMLGRYPDVLADLKQARPGQ